MPAARPALTRRPHRCRCRRCHRAAGPAAGGVASFPRNIPIMRAFDGQISGNRPIQRSTDEKKRQLRDLKEALGALKPHAAASLRESLTAKIKALEAELAPRR